MKCQCTCIQPFFFFYREESSCGQRISFVVVSFQWTKHEPTIQRLMKMVEGCCPDWDSNNNLFIPNPVFNHSRPTTFFVYTVFICMCVFAGRNIYRTLFKLKPPERNELFLPKRMAYIVDLEDEFGDFDIPNTIIRSKADCPSLEVGGMSDGGLSVHNGASSFSQNQPCFLFRTERIRC